jgi:exosome complex protein LRP1
MDTSIVESLLGDLDDNIDDLEEALGPLIDPSLSDTAGKLPVLDRAKLYVLATYAIESLLFCKHTCLIFEY